VAETPTAQVRPVLRQRMPGWIGDSLERQLAHGETVLIKVRPHPMFLAKPALTLLGLVVLWLWLVVDVAADTLAGVVELFIPLAAVWLIGREVRRRFTWFVTTDKRILKHEGIVTRNIPMMRLTKVTDLTYHQGTAGILLGYGTITIESAGQQQAIRELDYVNHPDEVYAALNAVLFGERPRERRERERLWRRLGKRRQGPDDPPPGPDGGGDGGRHPPTPGSPLGSGGVDVSPAGHPPPVGRSETIYRSRPQRPYRLGDTGEIPVVSDDDTVEIPVARTSRPDEDPLYPPRDWLG
jgi:membrane protein YdbS with pleckstrin-like domain